MSGAPDEPALPVGHPARFDYNPESPEAKAWYAKQRTLEHDLGTPPGYSFDPQKPHGGMNWVLGEDPQHPELEPFTGHPRRKGAAAASGASVDDSATKDEGK